MNHDLPTLTLWRDPAHPPTTVRSRQASRIQIAGITASMAASRMQVKNARSTCWAACAFVCSGVEKLPCEAPAALRCARRRLIPREHQQARDMCWSTRQHMGRLEGRGSQDLAGSPFPRVRTKSIAWTHTHARTHTHRSTTPSSLHQLIYLSLPQTLQVVLLYSEEYRPKSHAVQPLRCVPGGLVEVIGLATNDWCSEKQSRNQTIV